MKKVSKVRARKLAKAKIERLISANGGYSKEALEFLGVSWPPKKGWKENLIDQLAFGAPTHADAKNKSPGFYQSWEWKEVRYKAIKLSKQRCLCCGWQPGDTERGYLVVDHIKPRKKFPELALELSNLQVLCNDCNMGKSNTDMTNWMDEAYSWTIQ